MGTKVRLTQSGGFAGLSMVADVDLDELPAKAAKAVRAALAEVNFQPPSARPSRGGPADTYQYDLVVSEGDERTLTAHEPLADPALKTLLSVLLPLAKPE